LPSDLQPLPFAPADARALLAGAGYPGPPGTQLEIEILCAREVDLLRRILELAAPAFAAANVRLVPVAMAWTTIQDRLAAGEYDGVLMVQTHDLQVDPYPQFHSSESAAFGGYRNAEVDALLERARHEPDRERRLADFHAFSRIFHAEQPVTVLAVPRVQVLLHRRFRGVEVGPLGLRPDRWWVDPADRIVR
jgi:peptide/nickel transport system substrate-binding protein